MGSLSGPLYVLRRHSRSQLTNQNLSLTDADVGALDHRARF